MILDGKDEEEIENRTKDIMTLLEIESIGDKYSYTVSGGQQQRTAICRAIVNNPDIVFADEPTGNMDSKSSKAVMKCFEKLNELNGSTILMVTHDAFAASYCKKVIFLKDGNIIKEIMKTGSQKEFFDTILDTLAEIGGDKDDL
jgi:putative ABC transport system ATP-binding protein